jgi:hypothetical protein
LIKDKLLQKKLKQFILDELQNISENNNYNSFTKEVITYNNNFRKINSLAMPMKFNSEKKNFLSLIKPRVRSSKSIIKRKSRKNSSFYGSYKRANTLSLSKKIKRSSSFYENMKARITGLEHTIFNNNEKKKYLSHKGLLSKQMPTSNCHRIRRKSVEIIPYMKTKRKKDNLLSKIALNIQKTNQNLNNPEEFYNNYFNSLLLGEIKSIHNQTNDLYS